MGIKSKTHHLIIRFWALVNFAARKAENKIVTLGIYSTMGTVFLALSLFSCSPVRKIPENEYLLNRTKIQFKDKQINTEELERYEQQKPNKTILGLKFHLFLYNMASSEKEKFPHGWLKNIGEEPVIWDKDKTMATTEKYLEYLENKGYYHAKINDTVKFKKKKATVIHRIMLNEPYVISGIEYIVANKAIETIILEDTINSLIKKGDKFDKELMEKERNRIENLLKNHGYFSFTKQFILYEGENITGTKKVHLKLIVEDNEEKPLKPYRITNTYIYPDFNLNRPNTLNDIYADTILFEGNTIIYRNKINIKPSTVSFPNECMPGQLYSVEDIQQTNINYNKLGFFRIINITFKENDDFVKDSNLLDCYIELSPRKKQAYQFEIVGTNSAGDLGLRGNILYDNYNLFSGAEHLRLKLTGAIETISEEEESEIKSLKETGSKLSLTFPKFLFPFTESFIKKFSPKTNINVSYNYQSRPDYIRTIANTSFGYIWKGNSYNKHQLYILDFNYVRLPQGILSTKLREDIQNTPLQNSFIDHTIISLRYQFEYSNQNLGKTDDFIYFKSSLESAGNVILPAIDAISQNDSLFNVPYFRYAKGEFDFRIYNQITKDNQLVYRIFAGVGYPLGNSITLPFEKMYIAGGPYGIRAWNTRSLGPGSESGAESIYAEKLGDIKMEANLEYRFNLFWKLEGALFIDVGNIWLINENPSLPSGRFAWDSFYKQLAIGSGVGTRFDFSFFLIRIDIGIKLRDPAIKEGSKWIDRNPDYDGNRAVIQFGIGYPF